VWGSGKFRGDRATRAATPFSIDWMHFCNQIKNCVQNLLFLHKTFLNIRGHIPPPLGSRTALPNTTLSALTRHRQFSVEKCTFFIPRLFHPKFENVPFALHSTNFVHGESRRMSNYMCETFFPTTYRLTTIHPLYTDGQTDGRTHDNPCHKCPQHTCSCSASKIYLQEAQLSRRKADRTAFVRSPASEFQSQRESDLSEMTQFHARYVN